MTTNKTKADALTAEATDEAAKAAELAKQVAEHELHVAVAAEDMATLGAEFAAGAAKLTDGAIHFGTLVYDGTVVESDAPRLYLAFVGGYNSARTRGIDAMPADEKTAKSSISTFRTFGRATVARVASDVGDLYDRIVRVHGAMLRTEVNSAYQSMATVNRAIDAAVLKAAPDGKVDVLANVRTLTALICGEEGDDWVRGLIAKKSAPEKDVLAKIGTMLESIAALVEKSALDTLDKPLAGLVKAHASAVASHEAAKSTAKSIEATLIRGTPHAIAPTIVADVLDLLAA